MEEKIQNHIELALQQLNPAQREAAQHIDGAMLILAGAGSGKTKTLTTRLAYLIDEVGIPASSTLTLTFTNKAAQEMRDRALGLLEHSRSMPPPLLCTFHRFGLMFLRLYIDRLSRLSNFIVLDTEDKRAIIKDLSKKLPTSQFDYYISNMKNASLSPEESKAYIANEKDALLHRIYQEYEAFLLSKNLLDFDDLLYLTFKILDTCEDIAQNISQKYQYIMVDEYQDTNEIQYKILKRLALTHQNLCVVGDDDQSIYGWRGANVHNILNFSKQFDNVKVVKLEENYRSSTQILDAANKLISHNHNRLGKILHSVKGEGEAVRVIENEDETSEAQKVAQEIRGLLDQGVKASEIAILFRVNALSRSIEEGLNRAKIPYKLIGAMRFYERSEIKDLLSYLRLLVNLDDDFSFMRIVNRPKRGIGKITQNKLTALAQSLQKSCIACVRENPLETAQQIGEKNYQVIKEFIDQLLGWQILAKDRLEDLIEEMENNLHFEFSILDEVDREGNINEFYALFREYAMKNPRSHLEDFLNDLALSNATDEIEGEAVYCMSVHSAKGLEFQHLYIIGFEEGFFPLIRGEDEGDIEEERRLGYVAFTRAKDFLNISYAKSRFYRGKRERMRKSRFLKESNNMRDSHYSLDSNKESDADVKYCKGMKVQHKIFGIGIVQHIQGKGSQCQLQINFAGLERKILASFVQIVES
ncbi:ATP-dependent helicase [Helicobacter sp. MIT 05-5293]|uniref:ATP-dependent helicase n=1 Tax=Helicobacter sp. MIT 05-5293 TaxID=1548149 RepID=UPI0009DE59D1|nr:UvrD-helicase domain-containing protein [Helicobacter sp. MIT 05-5293]TLD82070.1 ATP-dependent helicase [Helicobacter sp. MIT 05-5293]